MGPAARATRPPKQVSCPFNGPARWLTADLGPGNDRLAVEGSLVAIGNVRFAGGLGDDMIKGGPEDDLIEAGFGADRLYGGAGADGLIGSTPGPDLPLRRQGRRPAGGRRRLRRRCPGRRPGPRRRLLRRDPGSPGPALRLLPAHKAWIDAIPGCHPVHLSPTDEDMEGSFDNDVLIGNSARQQHPRPARGRSHLRRRRR